METAPNLDWNRSDLGGCVRIRDVNDPRDRIVALEHNGQVPETLRNQPSACGGTGTFGRPKS